MYIMIALPRLYFRGYPKLRQILAVARGGDDVIRNKVSTNGGRRFPRQLWWLHARSNSARFADSVLSIFF